MNTPPGGAALAAFRLDDPEIVEAGDPGGMLRQVASSAAQVRTALRACAEADLSALSPDTRPRAIVVAGSGGAGGSAFACDALAAICGAGAPVQVTGVSGYQLPGWIGAADLVIAVSRSGHTAEALALAGEAARRGCDLVGVGAPGSPLQELAARARGTFIPVTTVGPARAMPWALTVPLLVVAARLGVARIDDGGLRGGGGRHGGRVAPVPPVERVVRQPGQVARARPGRAAAGDLGRFAGSRPRRPGGSPRSSPRTPSTRRSSACCPRPGTTRWRRSTARTRRRPSPPSPPPRTSAARASSDDGLRRRSPTTTTPTSTACSGDEASLRLVLLADPAGEHPAVERTRAAAASLAAVRGIDVSDITMDGGDPLRRLAGTVQLLDYASVYLGIASGIDPLAIAAIKDLRDLTGRE